MTTRNFHSQTERDFYDVMLTCGKYKESTVWHYITRIRAVEPMANLIQKDIDSYINLYTMGNMRIANQKSHGATGCALNRLKDYMIHRGYIA